MKKTLIFLSSLFMMALACDLSINSKLSGNPDVSLPTLETVTPFSSSNNSIPTEITENPTESAQLPSDELTPVNFGRLSLMIPSSVASGASGRELPRFDGEDKPLWQKTPGHLQVNLNDYYVLQGKFHQPTIYVYPAQEYAEMVPQAFESIRRVNNILFDEFAEISEDQLPPVPFFNSQQVFASNIKTVQFQNGSGVRFLTEYSQYPAPVCNHELFYNYQGVTQDGAYYINAIFPVSSPDLAETSAAAAALPIGEIAYPQMDDPDANWIDYYKAAADLLNAAPTDSFTPELSSLDALINSILIATP
jgi:hypothetical protein